MDSLGLRYIKRETAILPLKGDLLKGDFPGDAVIKNSPANAGDPVRSRPGKISRATEQLSQWATTTESARHNY